MLLAILAVAVGSLRGIRAGVFVGATYVVDFVATLTKDYVQRGRPDTEATHLLFGADSYGFPSGHTARGGAGRSARLDLRPCALAAAWGDRQRPSRRPGDGLRARSARRPLPDRHARRTPVGHLLVRVDCGLRLMSH